MGLPQVLSIVMDSFTSATERHIEVGDGLEMFVVRNPKTSSIAANKEDAPIAGRANEIDLAQVMAPLSVEEALGGEDEQVEGAVTVIRRDLKKD